MVRQPGRIRRVWLSVLILVALAVPVQPLGATQQRIELDGLLGEMSFELPSADWQRLEEPPEPGVVPRRVRIQRSGGLHVVTVSVAVLEAGRLLQGMSPPDFAAAYFTDVQGSLTRRADERWEGFMRREMEIGGVPFPTLSVRTSAESGVVDTVEVLSLPPDFTQRNRFYSVVWSDFHRPSDLPLPLTDLERLVSSLRVRPVGEVLVADDFEGASGALPQESANPARSLRGYVDGEYRIQKVETETTNLYFALLPGLYGNTSLQVDVRLADGAEPANLYLYCRQLGASQSGYRLAVFPATQQFRLVRLDGGQAVPLVNTRPSSAIGGAARSTAWS
jgi:hypothetical protein